MDSIRSEEAVMSRPYMTPEEIIREAGRKRKCVRIVYTDKKGESTWRETEPYEVKDYKYFGYCLEKEGIRAFLLENIDSAVMLEREFIPRWPVKF